MAENKLELQRLNIITKEIIQIKTEINRLESRREELNNQLIQLVEKMGRLEGMLMERSIIK